MNIKLKKTSDIAEKNQTKDNDEIFTGNLDEIMTLERHKKKLERLSKKSKEKASSTKQKIAGECARRLRILRDALELTAAQMAEVCNFNPSKYTRLENAITQLTKNDAICICISVLTRYKLVIETEWLLGKISQTPASLINLEQVQKKVKEYTDTFLEKNDTDSGIGGTVSIFLEMEQLGNIHRNRSKFIMVNDNRLLPQYKKGDYVGGLLVPKDLWFMIKGFPCIVELHQGEKVSVRNVHLTEKEDGSEYVILTTNTRDPELVAKDSILSIAIIFYHRYNGDDLAKALSVIHQHNDHQN